MKKQQPTNPSQENLIEIDPPRISFSALKTWHECSYKHKLVYIDKIKKFNGNEYTAFGTALHTVCENYVFNKDVEFLPLFEQELKDVFPDNSYNEKLVESMKESAPRIMPEIIPALNEYFESFEIVAVEEPLLENITEFNTNLKFKGFIDLILKTADGKYHIIDWKTCSWGWDLKRRSDRITTYQLTLYKKYYSNKYNINMKDIETHFGLLKRTAKKNHVEIFRVTSGDRKVSNALNLLEKAVKNIDKGFTVKNRLSCKRCEFYKTEYCE